MITIKSGKEIDLMKRAGAIVAVAHEVLSENISPGIMTIELDRLVEDKIRSMGGIPSFKGQRGFGDAPPYPASICASVNDEVVHGIPGKRILAEGDIISVDIGAILSGYHGDAARTYRVGNVSDEAEKLISVTKESFFKSLKAVRPGNRIIDISREVQDCVEKNGFSVVQDFVGHGIGREMHEEPQVPNYVTKKKGPKLMSGMALAIEPMVNEGGYEIRILDNKWTVVTKDGSLSAHYENTVIVTDGEPLITTIL
jgi:methionyl aminopeptidase